MRNHNLMKQYKMRKLARKSGHLVKYKKKKKNEMLPFATTWTELEGMYHTQ